MTWGPEKDVGREVPCQALESLRVWLKAVAGELTQPESKARKYSAMVSAVREQWHALQW